MFRFMGAAPQINVKVFTFNPFRENTYLVWDEEGSCAIIDPGCYDEEECLRLRSYISSEGLAPKAIWLTHGHFDHIFGVADLAREFSIPVFMSSEDKPILERDWSFAKGVGLEAPDVSFGFSGLEDGQVLHLGDGPVSFRVIATPGHTQGGVCFYCEGCRLLFSGDTLFAGAIGRSDLFGGDYDKEIVAIMEKLMVLPGDVDVLPGHGPKTSIAAERTSNPFLQPFNEPWEFETD